jgi:DNA-directed RNA polymerase subunit RPC12/RpoP
MNGPSKAPFEDDRVSIAWFEGYRNDGRTDDHQPCRHCRGPLPHRSVLRGRAARLDFDFQMELTEFYCSRCGQRITAPRHFGGRDASCPRCQKRLVAPKPAEDASAGIVAGPRSQADAPYGASASSSGGDPQMTSRQFSSSGCAPPLFITALIFAVCALFSLSTRSWIGAFAYALVAVVATWIARTMLRGRVLMDRELSSGKANTAR